MKIKELRSSFQVLWCHPHGTYDEGLFTRLKESGFDIHSAEDDNQCLDLTQKTPPHALLLSFQEAGVTSELIRNIQNISREIQIIVLAPQAHLGDAQSLYALGVHAVLVWPLIGSSELIATLDRMIEKNYYMFLSEQLAEHNNQLKMKTKQDPLALLEESAKLILQKKDFLAATEMFLFSVHTQFHSTQALFLKYVPHRQALVVSKAVGVQTAGDHELLGIELSKIEPEFKKEKLLNPNSLTSLRDFVRAVFKQDKHTALTVLGPDGIEGILVFMGAGSTAIVESRLFQSIFRIYQSHAEKLILQRKYHTVNTQDEVASVLNRQSFLKRLAEEVSRARRLNLPCSLVFIQMKPAPEQRLDDTREEFSTFVRMVAGILQKNSRVNDVVGRIGVYEFALILPHTPSAGALIKAKRLRKILPSAQYQKVLGFPVEPHFSLGVSEYPSFSTDADDLWSTCDEALYAAEKEGDDCICVSSPREGFTPDFQVKPL